MKFRPLKPLLFGLTLFITFGVLLFASHLHDADTRRVEPTNQGHNVSQWSQILTTNTNSPSSPLEIKRIVEDDKSGGFGVEVPLSYDLLLKNDFFEGNNRIQLKINGRNTGYLPFWKGTNGNCLLFLNSLILALGTNKIQVDFMMQNSSNMDFPLRATGPISEFVSSNLCHVNPFMASQYFKGVILYANLTVSNAVYTIKLQDTNGRIVKAISNTTTNAIIDERWDLVDSFGQRYRQPTVKAIYLVTVPNFISQTVEQIYRIESQ
jgi:hypothetical protein